MEDEQGIVCPVVPIEKCHTKAADAERCTQIDEQGGAYHMPPLKAVIKLENEW